MIYDTTVFYLSISRIIWTKIDDMNEVKRLVELG